MELTSELLTFLRLLTRLGIKTTVLLKNGSYVPWPQLLKMNKAQLLDIPKQSPESLVGNSVTEVEQDIATLITMLVKLRDFEQEQNQIRQDLLQKQLTLLKAYEKSKQEALAGLDQKEMERMLAEIAEQLKS